ncbi:MAG: S4 domain-containing protein [Acidobacteriota bacterium]|nr:S4 domain-containing protein [Acidobacteriota bacterium]
MRLDQFLRASRIVVRRTVAQELCEAGAVEVNGAPARSSRAVRVGDEIIVRRRERVVTARVVALPDSRNVSKSQAQDLYEIVKDERPSGDAL